MASGYKDGVFLFGMFCIFLVGLCFSKRLILLRLFKQQSHLEENVIGAALVLAPAMASQIATCLNFLHCGSLILFYAALQCLVFFIEKKSVTHV